MFNFLKGKSDARKVYERYNEQLEKCRVGGYEPLPPPSMWSGSDKKVAEEYAPMRKAMERRYQRVKDGY